MQQKAATESLRDFVRGAWRWVDSADYQQCWAIDSLCDHLEAVTDGHIKRLLINFPPRCGKSTVASIAWPAWTWVQHCSESEAQERTLTAGPQVKFLCSSYNYTLGIQLATKSRRLIQSPWYQERWPLKFRDDQNAKQSFDNSFGGGRMATSVGGSLLGIGGDIICIDDPHDTSQVESEVQRQAALDHFSELSTTRLNNPKNTPIVVIMQRLHEADISGHILDSVDASSYTHLCLPMHYDRSRHCHTVLWRDEFDDPIKTFDDPRTEQNELMWPERFDEPSLQRMARELGPYLSSGRLEQRPTPAGGSIVKEEWWQEWVAGTYPACEYLIASLDPAYTEKTENDPSGLTVWGVFRDPVGNPKVILLFAWDGRMAIHDLVQWLGAVCTKGKLHPDEARRLLNVMNDQRSDKCPEFKYLPRFPVDRLIVELKASGHSVVQEINRLMTDGSFGVEGVDPSPWGDKQARLHSVVHLFADQMIYAPVAGKVWRNFADHLIRQVSMFPKGDHDDMVDSTSMALRYLRQSGILLRREEHAAEIHEQMMFKSKPKPLYAA